MRPFDERYQGYSNYNFVLDKLEEVLNQKIGDETVLEFSKSTIVSRLKQQVTMDEFDAFMRKYASINDIEKSLSSAEIGFGSLFLNQKKGTAGILMLSFYKNCLLFFLLWSGTFIVFLSSFFITHLKKKVIKSPAVLIYGVPGISDLFFNFERFEGFILNQNEGIFSKDVDFIVQANTKSKSSGRIHYSRHPILYLLSKYPFCLESFPFFVREHFSALVSFISHSARLSIFSVLWRDFAIYSAVKLLNHESVLKAFVLTNTSWSRQYVWMSNLTHRKYRTYMIPYSMNFSPIIYKSSNSCVPQPILRQLRVDEMWVWSDGDISELKRLGVKTNFTIKKPVLWYEDNSVVKLHPTKFVISIFDVIPMNEKKLNTMGVGSSYYSVINMTKFITDIEDVCATISKDCDFDIILNLKCKRLFSDWHDENYISFIDQLSIKQKLNLIDPLENLFSLLRSSNLTISVPFSSPTYIASSLSLDAVFYDSAGTVHNDHDKNRNIKLISDKEGLKKYILEAIRRYKNR